MSVKRIKWIGENELLWSYYGQLLVVLRVTIFGGFDFMSVKRIKWIGENELLLSSISGSMSYNFWGIKIKGI
jgi:hypothetical protein